MTTVKLNKVATVIKNDSIKTFNKKSDFWHWASTQNCISITSNTRKKGNIKRLQSLGFNVIVDDNWGFDFDFKLIAKK